MMFQVEWIPAAAVLALAKANGMPKGDESPLDYCEASEAACTKAVPDFAAALAIGTDKLRGDFFGCVRIERLVKIKRSWGEVDWDADAVWHLAQGDTLTEDDPAERPEPMMYDGDTLLDA